MNQVLEKMSSEAKSPRVLYENLDTSFVNLWALLRYLSQRSFLGRVHVELENYSADVFLNGSETPLVHEIDREAGTDVVEQAALHRLVLRVRESSGSITVYEGSEESIVVQSASAQPPPQPSAESTAAPEPEAATPESMRSSAGRDDEAETVAAASAANTQTAAAAGEGSDTLRVSGELIGAVERAASSLGVDFASLFREARISLADDYTFLDPMTDQLRYENSAVAMNGASLPEGYVAGLSEALRRVVDQLATGERARRTRERIALELARVARKNSEALARSGFKEQLDRIAGTPVL